VEQGGGYCSGFPLCCGNPQRERETICELADGECCDDEWGGSCDPGFTCCDDESAGYCCPKADKNVGVSTEARHRRSRNHRRRDDLMRRG
jgi:hypothetical protein